MVQSWYFFSLFRIILLLNEFDQLELSEKKSKHVLSQSERVWVYECRDKCTYKETTSTKRVAHLSFD